MKFEYFISLRFLFSKKRNTFLSLITVFSMVGVAIGVTALITVLAVMEGLEYDLKEKIVGNSSHVSVYTIGGAHIEDYKNVKNKLKKIPGVKKVDPVIYKEAMLIGATGETGGVIVKGIPWENKDELARFFNDVKYQEKKEEPSRYSKIVIGEELAKENFLGIGDVVTLLSPMGEITPFGNQPRLKKFEIMGIFKSGYWEFDSKFVYIKLSTAQKFFSLGDTANLLEIKIDNISETKKMNLLVASNLPPIYYTKDWTITHRGLFEALKIEKTVMFIILTMIILVACFNIISTLIMMVMEKGKDISILKSIGSTTKSIMKIFQMQGMIIGIVGTFLGAILGLFLSFLLKHYIKYPLNPEVYFTDTLPVKVDFLDVLVIVVASLVISYLSTLYPAYRAAKLDPIEGIRYE